MPETNEQHGFHPSNTLKWLFLDLNSYFASVEQQDKPHLRGKPVAVVPMMTDSTCAIAASYEAKAYGIKTGTKIYNAKRMCPALQCVLARHDIYVDYHTRIFAELKNHIPINKICSIDEASCILMGTQRTEDNAIKLAHAIKQGIHDKIGSAIKCSIGIAPNAFLAKIATDMQKPNGLTILHPGAYKDQLFALKLRDLTGINVNMEHRLNASGIFTIEDFWNLSPKHARKIWRSVEGERFWYKLHGYDIPDKPTQKSVISHSRILEPALRPAHNAYAITSKLTIKAASRLRRYDLHARKFSLRIRTIDKRYWAEERTFSPAQDNFTFNKILEEMWQRMLWDMQTPRLLKVSVSIYDLHHPQDVTLDLFETRRPEKIAKNALSDMMDMLNKRYGANTVNIGSCPKTGAQHVGTKIAFNRIPDAAEFHE